MARIVGIVLGAGSSRRLGRPKQTLPFGDTTLLGHVLRDAEASSLDRVVLVLGGAAEAALAGAAPARAEVVVNEAYGSGCASSLLAGFDATGPADAVVLVLGDMPGVGPEVIDAVRAAWERDRPWAALADWRGTPGHPLAFSAEAFPALRALHGDKAVWKLIEADPGRVLRVPVDRDRPADVDTWADYEAVRGR
jgi:molybdenum cofactor cytidylyltransferase